MSLIKDLLLSCTVVMCTSFVISLPIITTDIKWQELEWPLCNLQIAEKDYVTYMFDGKRPERNLQPPAKIRFPVQNSTKEIQCTICTIIHYFDSQVPAIIDDLVMEHREDMTSNINKFNTVFKAAVGSIQDRCTFSKECQVNVTTSHDYAKKIVGLEIIHFARKWVEYFTNTTCVLAQA